MVNIINRQKNEYSDGSAIFRYWEPEHIIKEFDVDSGTLSFHLKKLEKVKLIAKKAAGKRTSYCVSPAMPKAFLQIFLIELANEGAAFVPLL